MSTSLLRLLVGIMITVMLAACAPGEITTQPVIEASPTATAEPTAVPLKLSVPSIGTTMLWMDGSTLIYIPPGEFSMGGDAGDNPARTVNLSAFWIYSTKMTNYQFGQCVASGGCAFPQDESSRTSLEDPLYSNRPVTGVDWEQAAAYCEWIGGSLPTEAQWEKTARGPSGNLHPWGDSEPTCDLLNFNHCVGRATNSNAYPAGMSLYGALDMAGNVFEWVADWYDPAYYETTPAENPAGPEQGETRSVRGSSFESPPEGIAVSTRSNRAPGEYAGDLGFRCVVDEPKMTAPYCQFSAYDAGGSATSSRDSCQIVVEQISEDCQVGNIVVSGVTRETANPKLPLSCTPLDKNPGFRCFAPRPNESGIVEVCGTCEESKSASYGTPALGCYPSYKTASANVCNYAAGSSAIPNGCPAGAVLVAEGKCALSPSSDNLCLPGTYFDAGAQMCIGNLSEQQCLSGHAFDAQNQCCRAAGPSAFPCPSGEYLAEYFGCLPLPGQETITSCTTVEVTLEFCMCYTFTDAGSCSVAGCKWVWNKNPPNFGRCDTPD